MYPMVYGGAAIRFASVMYLHVANFFNLELIRHAGHVIAPIAIVVSAVVQSENVRALLRSRMPTLKMKGSPLSLPIHLNGLKLFG
jgi:hypothetical protein